MTTNLLGLMHPAVFFPSKFILLSPLPSHIYRAAHSYPHFIHVAKYCKIFIFTFVRQRSHREPRRGGGPRIAVATAYAQSRLPPRNPSSLAVKGTRWNCIGLGLKFAYLISHNKQYIMDQYGNWISNQTYITAVSFVWRVLSCRRASVRVRETMQLCTFDKKLFSSHRDP